MIFDVKTCKRVVKINTRTNMGSTISPHVSLRRGNIGKQRSIIRASLVAVRKLSRSRLYLDEVREIVTFFMEINRVGKRVRSMNNRSGRAR